MPWVPQELTDVALEAPCCQSSLTSETGLFLRLRLERFPQQRPFLASAPLHRQLDGLVHRNIHRVST